MKIHLHLLSLILTSFCITCYSQEVPRKLEDRLADCSAFFGILSTSNVNRADQYKAVAIIFSIYLAHVVPMPDMDKKISDARNDMMRLITSVREGKNDDRSLADRISMCAKTWEEAETDVWPKMSEIAKAVVPRLNSE